MNSIKEFFRHLWMEVTVVDLLKMIFGVAVALFTISLLVMIPCAAMGFSHEQMLTGLRVVIKMMIVGGIGFGIFYWCFK